MSKGPAGLRALVVDDYPTIRARLCEVVRDLGLEVTEADNGVQAMECLRNQPFDIVFTDIVMPEMDGFELCEEIRNSTHFGDVLIVVVSTHYDANYVIKALRLGADDYVPKPIERELVERVIARVTTPVMAGA